MLSISPVDRPAEDLDISRSTASQDATLDSRSRRQGGRRRRGRLKRTAQDEDIEIDTFEPGSAEETELRP